MTRQHQLRLDVYKPNPQIALLAYLYCKEKVRPQVCQSAAGYYIGSKDPEDGSPFSRESEEYYPTHEDAERALLHLSWTQRIEP